ncbi:MAG: hypothetical protein HY905_05395 [Deltaproteobacteria bacterium]|nr:hypothetical protein [Deltaproteobacteria bacterium]
MRRLFAGVALVTCSTLLLEILLTRIFSYTLYYHFAFLVISLALFGLGVSGVVLYVRAERYPREKLEELLAHHAKRFALWTVVALIYVLYHGVTGRFDLFNKPRFTSQTFFELAMMYGVTAVPMYYSGMVVSLAITHLRERIGELYFYDLAGASLGCLLAGPLLSTLGAENAVLLVAAAAAGASLVFQPRTSSGRWSVRSAALTAGLLALLLLNLLRPTLRVGSFKEVDERYVTFAQWNSFSRVVVEERPGQARPAMYIDAMAKTEVHSAAELDEEAPPDEYSGASSLVYAVRGGKKALIIGPGGGTDVVGALRAGNSVLGVEINPIIAHDVMQGRYLERTGGLYKRPDVRIAVDEGRSFVHRTSERFDVIQATLVDTWAATASGAFALTENYLYTVEAFVDYLKHLTPDGILSFTRWCIAPDMECLRVVTLAREALRRVGVPNADAHVFVAYKNIIGTILVRRTPFPPEEADALVAAANDRGMMPIYVPRQERQDTLAKLVRAPDPQPVLDAFPSDISPVYDDRPFFFYGVRPHELFSAVLDFDKLMINSFSVAVLIALFAIVALLVLAFILVPLLLHRRDVLRSRPLSKLRDLGFFVAIGVGFIVVEVVLLQRFGLFLGHPSHSLVVVLFSLLLAGGVGSFLSERIPERHRRLGLALAAGAVIVILLAYVFLLPWVFDRWLGAGLQARIGIAALLTALPGLAMGMMLPSGVRLISTRHPEIVPWGWGLNGAASVFGSVAAMVVAMNLGSRASLFLGAACYALALLAGFRRPGTLTPEPAGAKVEPESKEGPTS